MGSISVTRNRREVLFALTWVDDVQVEWVGSDGACVISAALDFQHADARIIIRRGLEDRVVISALGDRMSYTGKHTRANGDVVVLQWRALTTVYHAKSEVAELTITEIRDQFEG